MAQRTHESIPSGPLPSAVRRPPVPGRARRSRAQALVEFALITPLMFALVFGIIEFGWLFRSHLTVYYATLEAARNGAIAGAGDNADTVILFAISDTMQTMSYADLRQVLIYDSGSDGACLDPCDQHEQVYHRDDSGWVLDANGWPPRGRVSIEPTDRLGVELTYVHHFLVNFLPGAIGTTTITNHSVVQIEPIAFQTTPTPVPQP